MNYHIMADEKFIDDFIDDAEKVCEPNTNLYFIRQDQINSVHVKHPLAKWVNIFGEDFKMILNSVTPQDKIFIHWYDLPIGKLMLNINKRIPLYVALWGGDFYEDPFLYHLNWIHDSLTLRYVKKHYIYPETWATRPGLLLKQLLEIKKKYRNARMDFDLKKQTVRRINYILLDPNNTGEVELTKKMYGVEKLVSLPFNYNLNFDQANSMRREQHTETGITNILVGNSGTESNNHADCFKVLEKYKTHNIAVSVPLSYGSKEYIEFVKSKAVQTFKEKFEPIEDFKLRKEYIHKLNSVDIGIMYHNRSQAFGNMITLLSLGKKLFLKRNNPFWELFQKTGIKVFDANAIKNLSFSEFSKLLSREEIQSNVEKVSNLFSEKKRLEYLKQILS